MSNDKIREAFERLSGTPKERRDGESYDHPEIVMAFRYFESIWQSALTQQTEGVALQELNPRPIIDLDKAPVDVQGEVLSIYDYGEYFSFSWDNEDNEAMPATAAWLESYNVYRAVFEIPEALYKEQPESAPEISIKCETTSKGITGITSLNVLRVEKEDDGSWTAVTDHWPRDSQPTKQPAQIPDEWHTVLENLLSYTWRRICMHEDTHRGGCIWEICDQCGAMWADDEGGKPEFVTPPEIEAAEAMLAAIPK